LRYARFFTAHCLARKEKHQLFDAPFSEEPRRREKDFYYMSTPQQNFNPRRPLITGVPFFLPVAVPFTGVANEALTVFTQPKQTSGDLEIIGAVMDLESVQGQFTIDKRPIFSSENIPLAMYFGKPDGPKPIIWHQPTTPLASRQRIRADLINTNGEGEGTLVFICRQLGVSAPMSQALMDYQGQGSPDVVVIDSGFTGTALNDTKQNSSPRTNEDFIWKTLHTDLQGASVRIVGIDGRSWMDDFVPLWAIAGRATSVLPNQTIQPQCFIPAEASIKFEFKNVGVGGVAEASGKVYLGGQRIPRR
jgi:hypothetical protein